MRQQPVVGTYDLVLEQRGPQRRKGLHKPRRGRKAQTRYLEIRVAHVSLQAPKQPGGPLSVFVVFVQEPEPPEEGEALEWMLLTSEGIPTVHDARTVIG